MMTVLAGFVLGLTFVLLLAVIRGWFRAHRFRKRYSSYREYMLRHGGVSSGMVDAPPFTLMTDILRSSAEPARKAALYWFGRALPPDGPLSDSTIDDILPPRPKDDDDRPDA